MRAQRGHGDMGMTLVLGWAATIVGMVLTSGGLWALWVGVRMLLK